MQRTLLLLTLVYAFGAPSGASATVVDFEDAGANLPIAGLHFYDGRSASPGETDFVSRGATFANQFTNFGGGCCWQGFAYSQTTDTVTPGPSNQTSAIAGSGASGSATFGIGFTGGASGGGGVSTIDFGAEVWLDGAWFTNTTWAALSMRDGDPFAKQFGGASGSDPDWFALTIHGLDGDGVETGSVVFYLADYRFADDGLDYIVTSWTFVDLSGLGPVAALDFSLDSSDTSFGFLNTPAYFALDDLQVVPEPSTGLLLALGLAALRRRRAPRG